MEVRMQTATLSSSGSEGQDSIESLGLSGTTLMQLWAIGVATISDLTSYNTDSLRKRLTESLNGSAAAHQRIEHGLSDIHTTLSAKRVALRKENEKVEMPAVSSRQSIEQSGEEPKGLDGKLEPPDHETLDRANAETPRLPKDTLEQFYRDIQRYGVLSREAQTELGRRILEEKDMEARDLLVLHNLRLVLWVARKQLWATIARKKEWSALEFADLVQEGIIGLMIAAEKYDYRQGFTFMTYAQWWVRSTIGIAILNSGLIRIPAHLGELLPKIRRAMNEIALREGRPPTLLEIATAVGASPKRVKSALKAAQMQVVSIDEPLITEGGERFDEGDAWHERIADETALRADHIIEAREELDAACGRLNRLIEVLYTDDSISDRNKEIFVRFYGLDGSLKKRTFEHVAEGYDITRQAIEQVIRKCWDKLQLSADMDHDSVVEELTRIAELEKLAHKKVSTSSKE